MEYIFITVLSVAGSLYAGIELGDPLFGVGMAVAAVVLVQLWRLWRRFWAEHPKLAKAGMIILGAFFVIGLSMAGVPLFSLAVCAAICIALISAFPGICRRETQKSEEALEQNIENIRLSMEERRRRDALDAQKRKAARAEAEHLEDLARLWERNAQKYGAASDIRKARDYREQANAAWRKIR